MGPCKGVEEVAQKIDDVSKGNEKGTDYKQRWENTNGYVPRQKKVNDGLKGEKEGVHNPVRQPVVFMWQGIQKENEEVGKRVVSIEKLNEWSVWKEEGDQNIY